ncbi:MAG TPA: phosphoglucosamine mutase [Actinomycetes bacterium]|nr:phosphoglucosamine mutase [Actinomycetes bacterium]
MGRLFGTDGVRGLANGDLTAELALDLSVAAAHVLGEAGEFEGHRPKAVVGRDTRASGEFLEAAVVAGLASAGIDVIRLGVIPTPGVAFLTDDVNADIGVMLSASHNPMPDNGIKFFARGGHKLADSVEDAIEHRLREPWPRPTGSDVGRVIDAHQMVERYIEHLTSSIDVTLDGLRIVIDCANGAASYVGPEALRRAGADVVAIHDQPDGLNINEDCGSTHMDSLRVTVVNHGADAGIALDGDADRCLAIASDGSMVDGDHILTVLALAMRDSAKLNDNTVVSTVMANLGFRIAMDKAQINVVATAVGDRYVLEAMRAEGLTLGGEQSGHVLMLEHATTGDGVLTGLHLLSQVAVTRKPLAELAGAMTRLPQVLINVSDVDKSRVDDPQLAAAVVLAQQELGDTGRVLLRPSGTEPLVRVMVEAVDAQQAQTVADQLAEVVRQTLR